MVLSIQDSLSSGRVMHPVDNCSDKVLLAHRFEPIFEAPARLILQWSGWQHGDIPTCRNMGTFVGFAVYSIQETTWTRFLSPQRPEVFMQEVCVPIAKKAVADRINLANQLQM